MEIEKDAKPLNFIEKIIEDDLREGRVPDNKIVTRFPPEPNGYLHIGHIKSICLNFGLAEKYNGICHLRLDDTNPAKEDMEYINSIKDDIHWLGFDWGNHEYYASDYYDQLYEIALDLIRKGKAYVDSLSPEEMKAYRGTLTEPGKNSPDRDRSIEENMDLFLRMKNGEFPEGKYTLRAKIDMASPNINMRDPALYRIKYAEHPRTGNKWCIYPMYDFTHPISDAIEGITHSICTLEFEDHRPAYDWATSIDNIDHTPHQYEFARLNITYCLMSKRRLLYLVNNNFVSGWDDPRMPTVSGIRRRGYSPEAMKDFVARVGVAKVEGMVDFSLMEFCVREDLNKRAKRLMAVLDPLKIIIDNYPEDKVEYFESDNNPEDPASGKHSMAFTKELYIEREDFMEVPVKGYHRLYPGNEIRLKGAYYVKAVSIDKDENGNIVAVHCTYDPETKSGSGFTGRKVKGTIHWVDAKHAVPAEFRLYEPLVLDTEGGNVDKNFLEQINPNSMQVLNGFVEPIAINGAKPLDKFQMVRNGFFSVDTHTKDGKLIFNRIVPLKSSFKLK